MDSELKQHLEAMESRIITHTEAHVDARLKAMESRIITHTDAHVDARLEKLQTAIEDRMTEKMRDMQTELLRGFSAFSENQTIRLRKVEVDQSNLDAAISGRVNTLEKRLLEIELRLGLIKPN